MKNKKKAGRPAQNWKKEYNDLKESHEELLVKYITQLEETYEFLMDLIEEK